MSYRDEKVITIGIVSELTGLTLRQIRYYEERQLIFPKRTSGGTRKYSFSDIDKLVEIANKIEDGIGTFEIKKNDKKKIDPETRNEMIRGQLNSTFNVRR